MSNDKLYLNKSEQVFLMEMFEVASPQEAVELFITMMVECRANPDNSPKYLKKIMAKWKEKQGV